MLDRGLYMVSGTKHRYFIRRGPFQANEFSGVNVLSTLFLVNVLPSASRKRSHDSSVFQKKCAPRLVRQIQIQPHFQ